MNKDNCPHFCAYLSLFVSITLSCLWCWNTGSFKVVNLDTFVGVIVALLAILITIVLGWQIFNAIELKQKVNDLEQLKAEFIKQQNTIQQLNYKTTHAFYLIWGEDAFKRESYPAAFRYFINALKNSLLHTDALLNIESLHGYIEHTANKITKGMKQNEDSYNEVVNIDKEIRQMREYPSIKYWYEDAYNKYIKCVNKNG